MIDLKINVKADRVNEVKENMPGIEPVPVDMYGKRVFTKKDPKNMQAAMDDINNIYNTKGNRGMK